jgi:dTDP-L-rhamnose 4-epimerase
MKQTILVTGGAGFIGSHVVDKLVEKGYSVRIFDNLDEQVHEDGIPAYLNKRAKFIHGDVRDKEALLCALRGVDIVVHLAASVGVGQSMYKIKHYVDNNTSGTANLLDTIVNNKLPIKKIVVAGSMSSYGEGAYCCTGDHNKRVFNKVTLRGEKQMKDRKWEHICPECGNELIPIPTNETKPLDPQSIYALTKMDQEIMTHQVGKAYKIPTVVLRYFNVYGPRQSMNNPYTGAAAMFMARLRNNHRPLIYEDGQQIRDFTSVHDITDATILAIEKKAANYQTYNVGTGIPTTIYTLAQKLAKLSHKNIIPETVGKYRVGDIRHCYADITKIQKELGYSAKVTLDDGLQELISWSKGSKPRDRIEEAQKELTERKLV